MLYGALLALGAFGDKSEFGPLETLLKNNKLRSGANSARRQPTISNPPCKE